MKNKIKLSILLVISGCRLNTNRLDPPKQDPCAPAVTECVNQAHYSNNLFQEPPLLALESETFCDTLLTTLPLASASASFNALKAIRSLVSTCYEYGKIPLSSMLYCEEAVKSADKHAATSIEQYSVVTVRLMESMTPKQAISFTRATNLALNGDTPFSKTHACLKQEP